MSNINLRLQNNKSEKSIGQKLCDYLAVNSSNTILFQALDRIEKGLDSDKVISFWQNVSSKSELPYEEVVKLSIEKQKKVLKAAIAKKPILEIQDIAKDRKKKIEDLRLEQERLEQSKATQVSALPPTDKLQVLRERFLKPEELPNAETIRKITAFYSSFKLDNNINPKTIGMEKFEYFEGFFKQIVENLSFNADDYRNYKLPDLDKSTPKLNTRRYLAMKLNPPFKDVDCLYPPKNKIPSDISEFAVKKTKELFSINKKLSINFQNWVNSIDDGGQELDASQDFPEVLFLKNNLNDFALIFNSKLHVTLSSFMRYELYLQDKDKESLATDEQSPESETEKKDRKTVDQIVGFVKKVNDLAETIKSVNSTDLRTIRASANKLKTLDPKAKEEIERKCKKSNQSKRVIEFTIWGLVVENTLLKSSLFNELFGDGNEWDSLVKRISTQFIESNPNLQGNTLFLKHQVFDNIFELEDGRIVSGLINLAKHIVAHLPEELFNFDFGLSDYGKELLNQKKKEILGIGEGVKSSESLPIKIDLEPVKRQILDSQIGEDDPEELSKFVVWVKGSCKDEFNTQNSPIASILNDVIVGLETEHTYDIDQLLFDLESIIYTPEFMDKYIVQDVAEVENDLAFIRNFYNNSKLDKSTSSLIQENWKKQKPAQDARLKKYDIFSKCFPEYKKITKQIIDILTEILTKRKQKAAIK